MVLLSLCHYDARALSVAFFLVIQVVVIQMLYKRFQGEAFSTHKEKSGQSYSTWRAVGIAVLLVPVVVGFYLVGVATLGILIHPQDIEVWVDAPLVVNEGESFEIGLHAHNTGDTQVTLVGIDIPDEYLRGIVIESSDPPFSASEKALFVVYYSYDLPIDAGQELEIILQASGEVQGNYYDYFRFCIDSELTCLVYRVLTTVQ